VLQTIGHFNRVAIAQLFYNVLIELRVGISILVKVALDVGEADLGTVQTPSCDGHVAPGTGCHGPSDATV
jgi:hypothetical protein